MLLAFTQFSLAASTQLLLVSPVEKFLPEGQAIELGSAQPGERIELIFSANSGTENPWESVKAESIPQGWNAFEVMQERNDNTLIVMVEIPKDSSEGAFRLDIKAENSQESRRASIIVFVEEGLLSVQLDSLQKKTIVGEQVQFLLFLNNDSIAEHSVIVKSSLPLTWFSQQQISISPKSAKQAVLKVFPKNYGEKKFSLTVISSLNGKTIAEIKPRLEVKPTLKSKYEAAMYGFPFFTPSLIPYYIFNSFISQLS
ncbi:MAG TPA: hypothetical protein HA222_03835 [Candidatus Diapherotrites archaeon]|nr:hypothetical protein [Candidatus Diapherotrites archaeon]